MALACAQDVSEVLDPLHVPVAQDDKDLFKEKQKYMFAVFDHTLQTDTGKALAHEHENDFDAQKIYVELVKFYLKSTKASLDSSNLLSYIPLPILALASGRALPTVSSSTGKTRSACMRSKFLPLTISLMARSEWCSKMLYTQ